MLLHRAVERGLTAADFENMTIGMIIDYLTTCQNEDLESRSEKHDSSARPATQADVDAW